MATAFVASARPPVARPVWLITLADLVALLLTFFVLIFSMSTVHSDRWDALVEGLPGGVLAVVSATEPSGPPEPGMALVDPPLGIDLGYLDAVLQDHLARDPILAASTVSRIPGALVVSLPAHLLFDSGSETLRAASGPALFRLGGLIGNLRNEIAVIGHTDPVPMSSSRFPSNWELSLGRAAAVGEALRRAGYSRAIQVTGAGAGRFADTAAEADEHRRHALARRVDLLIRDTKGH